MKNFLIITSLVLSTLFFIFAWLPETPKHKAQVALAHNDPETMDPRFARKQLAKTPLHMAFEGLMRHDQEGKLAYGVAESVTVAPDYTTFVFNLRRCCWSNGDPLTSFDFLATWKSLLSPEFPAPYAYQFYHIVGARGYKEGALSWENVGIYAPNKQTLVVKLEHPTPYFLELTSSHFFFPVHKTQRESTHPVDLIGNGPFVLRDWRQNHQLSFEKNVMYWDAQHVQLDSVVLQQLDEYTAVNLYNKGELDWVGGPCSTLPAEAVTATETSRAAATQFIRVNTTKYPLNSLAVRQRLASAIEPREIAEKVLADGTQSSYSFTPSQWCLDEQRPCTPVLADIILPPELAKIKLSYPNVRRSHLIAQAIQQQWMSHLGIKIELDPCESGVLFEKLGTGSFDLALGIWFADFHDPINFLDVFARRENLPNCTGWENASYRHLLERAEQSTDLNMRSSLHAQAEAILLDELPVFLLFHPCYTYKVSPQFTGFQISELGYLDLKHATKDE